MKFLSLFSGIGAPEKALERLNIQYELIGYSEIDKYASRSYSAIHNISENMNLGDITKINEKELPKDIDLIAYGFPCQDISNAGKMKGLFNKDGTQTRSGLFFDALRIIKETKPRVAIAENVKALTSKKFSEQFKIILDSLEAAGYNNYWKILNSLDFGIPQKRERVFIVSIRKDIDTGMFRFPEGFPLQLKLKDMLEDSVDEKYFISDSKIVKIKNSNFKQEKAMIQYGDICGTLLARDYKDPKCVPVFVNNSIEVKEATKKGYTEAFEGDSINFEQPNSKTRRGRVGRQVAQTITTSPQQGVVINGESASEILRIRKMTPKECFRLQGFDDDSFHKAEAVNSNTQLYKQAGNSITISVPQAIFEELINANILSR